MELKNLKGTFDFLPNEQKIRNDIINTLRNSFEKYGYMPLETPILNYYEMLAYKYEDGDEILNEIYKLNDQADRKLALRYDLTVPFCKVVGMQKGLRLPFRRYEIGKVFRNGPVKLGRTREFYQCDIDVVGIDGRLIEVEQVDMAINTYKELGIDVIVKYNNRKLMSGLIIESGVNEDQLFSVIGIIDKLDKISKDEINDMLIEIGILKDSIDKLFDLFGKNVNEYNEIFKNTTNQLIKEGIKELIEVQEYFKQLDIIDNTIFDSTLARGLQIYTGIVFEFYDKEKRLTSALGAGGRYDKIITNFVNDGNEYPAVGLSFGLEPIYAILKDKQQNQSLIDYYIIPMDTEVECLKLANIIRNKGYKVIIEMNKKKISKCFDFANKENIPNVIVVGENEIKNNTITIKNMKDSTQKTITNDEFIKEI